MTPGGDTVPAEVLAFRNRGIPVFLCRIACASPPRAALSGNARGYPARPARPLLALAPDSHQIRR